MISITEAVDGEVVTIGGTVEAATAPLEGPLSGEPCVVYEIYDGFDDDRPNDRGAVDFVVRDDVGKARVIATHLDASLLGQARRQQVQSIDANIHDVSAKLSDLKDRAANVQGPAAKELHAVMRRYKRVATLLCAMKAHARGKVHGAMSAAEQARFIARENAALQREADEGDTLHFDIERVEALLTLGQRVHVTGPGRWEIDSEGGAGYRQAGRVLVLEGTAEAPLRVTLQHGEVQRMVAKGAREITADDVDQRPTPPPSLTTASRSVAILIAVAIAILVLGVLLQ